MATFLSTLLQILRLTSLTSFLATLITTVLFTIYAWINDKALSRRPPELKAFSPAEWSEADFEAVQKKLDETPIKVEDHLPGKTGRRYIVTGGTGFLGGWIVIHLLKRGEDPHNIRIIDLRPPTRRDLLSAPANEVEFVQADISNSEQVEEAFRRPWPSGSPSAEITVFHTAATIRFYDRHPSLLPLSTRINVQGTANVIRASRKAGVDILIATSSVSVKQRPNRLWCVPLREKMPGRFVQVLSDDPDEVEMKVEKGEDLDPREFVAMYSASKLIAEKMVREADGIETGAGIYNGNESNGDGARDGDADGNKSVSTGEGEGGGGGVEDSSASLDDGWSAVSGATSFASLAEAAPRTAHEVKRLRTGCIRPGNSIYGPGSDVFEYFLEKGRDNPTFFKDIMSTYVYVENCSLAHLCYEARLIEVENSNSRLGGERDGAGTGTEAKDIGGQAFTVTDPGPPVFWTEIFAALSYFTQGRFAYYPIPATPLLLLAHILEAYSLFRYSLLEPSTSGPTSAGRHVLAFFGRELASRLPPLPPFLMNMQPSMLNFSLCHTFVDDSRARTGKEVGGLGYRGAWTTLEGVAETVKTFEKWGRLDKRDGRFEAGGEPVKDD